MKRYGKKVEIICEIKAKYFLLCIIPLKKVKINI